jgi:hypothetical protein
MTPQMSNIVVGYRREFFDVHRQRKCFIIYGELETPSVEPQVIKCALEGDVKARHLLFDRDTEAPTINYNGQNVADNEEQPMLLDLSKPSGSAAAVNSYVFPHVINSSSSGQANVYQPNLPQDIATQGEIKSSLQQTVPHTSQLTVNPDEFKVLETAAQVRNWGGYETEDDPKADRAPLHQSQLPTDSGKYEKLDNFSQLKGQWKGGVANSRKNSSTQQPTPIDIYEGQKTEDFVEILGAEPTAAHESTKPTDFKCELSNRSTTVEALKRDFSEKTIDELSQTVRDEE